MYIRHVVSRAGRAAAWSSFESRCASDERRDVVGLVIVFHLHALEVMFVPFIDIREIVQQHCSTRSRDRRQMFWSDLNNLHRTSKIISAMYSARLLYFPLRFSFSCAVRTEAHNLLNFAWQNLTAAGRQHLYLLRKRRLSCPVCLLCCGVYSRQ